MKRLISEIKKNFINGLLVILPVGLTIWALWLIYRFINSFTGPNSYIGGMIKTLLNSTIGRSWFPGIGAIFTFIFVFLIGLATRIYVGRKIYEMLDSALESTPLVRKMYATVKQITSALFNRDMSSFRDVVLVEYPRKGIYSLGFVTNEHLGKLEDKIGEDAVSVFIFSTPNPLTGMTHFVPRDQLTYLDINIEAGLRLVLSMGIVIPASLRDELLTNRENPGGVE